MRRNPFQFLASWLTHQDFDHVVKEIGDKRGGRDAREFKGVKPW